MAKIIGFPAQPNPETTHKAFHTKRPRAVDWTTLVHHSLWWRLADHLLRECAVGPLKLSASGELPSEVVATAAELRDSDAPDLHNPGLVPDSESEFAELAEVRNLMEAEGILVATRRNLSLSGHSGQLLDTTWQLWPIIHHALGEKMGRSKAIQAGAASIFKKTLPASLGF